MDLNKTWCASDCQNLKCKTMLSQSVLMAAESRGVEAKHDDLSADCKDYQPKTEHSRSVMCVGNEAYAVGIEKRINPNFIDDDEDSEHEVSFAEYEESILKSISKGLEIPYELLKEPMPKRPEYLWIMENRVRQEFLDIRLINVKELIRRGMTVNYVIPFAIRCGIVPMPVYPY